MRFSYSLHESTSNVKCNPKLMDRILGNILANAIIHGCDKSTINLESGRKDRGFYVAASNVGYIPDTQKIFERRYTTKKGEGGTGLGLTIVKGFVERQGGKVSVDNMIIDGKPLVRFEVYIHQ